MTHIYITKNGEHLTLTQAFAHAAEQEGVIYEDTEKSTMLVTYWRGCK